MSHVTDLAGSPFFSMRLRSWSNVPCEVHALMQYTDDQSVLFHFPIEYDVGLIFVPPEYRCEFISRSSLERVLSKSFQAVS
mgnify:CR=1 FL=1